MSGNMTKCIARIPVVARLPSILSSHHILHPTAIGGIHQGFEKGNLMYYLEMYPLSELQGD
jgi:hypothetical protein